MTLMVPSDMTACVHTSGGVHCYFERKGIFDSYRKFPTLRGRKNQNDRND